MPKGDITINARLKKTYLYMAVIGLVSFIFFLVLVILTAIAAADSRKFPEKKTAADAATAAAVISGLALATSGVVSTIGFVQLKKGTEISSTSKSDPIATPKE